ncbi:hypothetical protein AALO_G00126760 [Alosa alosa]|uniref:Ig-like domain-containing protein n=1 Tax=Alosa alosa TaxID=278164 RepID=A0AAV6GLA5_9TELE|nr:ICOS ligand-like isoform X1 [Alosa sapidissima]XP_041913472.1 ICOS ligand-like isoform X1 [Alosa sapidissima]XP_041913473.1 ICOS ligand-like isoform X1 [Alosa sapidissima]XP_048107445.1 ICOS ligand-like isoform X1 [Alosa alosa]XP_048107446.1 ICOS ligand-like isoform X1 [Alosa alosa]KAG5275993.1 hypothetical protein AALO_G00126760 [Alosa alosa]
MTPRWFAVLLLGLVKQSSSEEDECSVGVIGESAILPCIYNGTQSLLSANISAWWRSETEEMLRAMWRQGEEILNVSLLESSRVLMPSLCPQTGDFSMTLTGIVPMDAKTYSLHISFDDEETSSVLCTVCLKVGAHFSFPVIQRGETNVEHQTQFVCHSRGGYPQAALHWLINSTDQPPSGSVKAYAQPLQDSELYNITSVMTVSNAKHIPVTCTVENRILNETFSTIYWPEEKQFSPVVARASEAMLVFSTVVIIIVSLLVAMGIVFQVKWDRERRRPRLHEDDSDTEDTDITMDMEHLDSLTDTVV